MKTKIQVVIAVLIMIGAAYWGFTSIRSHTYRGSNIMFPVGGGHAIVSNPGDMPVPIEMRSGERVASFRIASADLGLSESSKRQGSGRDAFHSVTFELPPGQARIDVVSGSGVMMISRADTRIEATVVPIADSTVRWILMLSGGVIVWALYYISRVTEHRWVAALRNRMSGGNLEPKQTTT
jgi:hypothetical protein